MNQFIFSFILFNCYSVFGKTVVLQSKIPAEPIEDPKTWSWGLHPDNGLDYSAKVQKPKIINLQGYQINVVFHHRMDSQ